MKDCLDIESEMYVRNLDDAGRYQDRIVELRANTRPGDKIWYMLKDGYAKDPRRFTVKKVYENWVLCTADKGGYPETITWDDILHIGDADEV